MRNGTRSCDLERHGVPQDAAPHTTETNGIGTAHVLRQPLLALRPRCHALARPMGIFSAQYVQGHGKESTVGAAPQSRTQRHGPCTHATGTLPPAGNGDPLLHCCRTHRL